MKEFIRGNTGMIRNINVDLIRSAFMRIGTSTKACIARETGLSVPTVNKLVDALVQSGELLDTQRESNSGGRNAKLYVYNAEFSMTLCMHFEKTDLWYEIVDSLQYTVRKGAIKIKNFAHIKAIETLISTCLEEFENIQSIAIGVPAGVDHGELIFVPDYANLHGIRLDVHIREKFNVYTVLENDVNAAAVGYYVEHGDGLNNMAALYVGDNGPGAGIIVNGEIVHGFSGFGGEIAFIQINEHNMQELVMTNQATAGDFAKILCSICTVINPQKVILFKSLYRLPDVEKIIAELKCLIPSRVLPELILNENWEKFYFLGLKQIAQNRGLRHKNEECFSATSISKF